ncbi:hypothetical protein MMC26_007761 [Xylographa opegraphella]|nr:hypothetical protein [Xylographa opegraphella]
MQASLKIDIRNVQPATSRRFFLVAASTLVEESEVESLVRKDLAEKSPRDPLDWFGILVPPALGTAQAAFKSALNEAVSNVINISVEMRDLEAEVEGLRRRIRSTE